jgi:type VI secretion system secreted protein Hcp
MAINAYLELSNPVTANGAGQSTTNEGVGSIGVGAGGVTPYVELLGYDHEIEFTIVENTMGSNVSRKSGRVKHNAINVKKHIDQSSPMLNQKCSEGVIFPTMCIHVFNQDNAGGAPVEMFRIEMTNVQITKVGLSADGDSMPEETVSLMYTRIIWTFKPQTNTYLGGAIGQTSGMWDLQLNAAAAVNQGGTTQTRPTLPNISNL